MVSKEELLRQNKEKRELNKELRKRVGGSKTRDIGAELIFKPLVGHVPVAVPVSRPPPPPPPEAPITKVLTPMARSRTPDSAIGSTQPNSPHERGPAITPITRGKRTRQPSPDKFLTTPEVREIEQGRRARKKSSGGSKNYDEDDEGNNTEVGQEPPMSGNLGDRNEEIVAVFSPVNGNKRRKLLNEVEGEMELGSALELEPELELVELELQPEPGLEAEPESERIQQEIEATPKPEEAIHIQQPRRKRQIEGKKPASPLFLPGDDEEEEEQLVDYSDDEPDFDPDTVTEDALGDEEENEEPLPTPMRRKPAKPDKPSAKKHKQKPREQQAASAAQNAEEDVEEEAASFPVMVHRLSKVEGFTLASGSQRGGVNAIDVINQVFMEIIDRFFLKLKSNAEKKAVESFKEELGVRFVELTDALENNIALATRVRRVQKQKTQLRNELLSLKQEREKIAVKIDNVRKTHEFATASSNIQLLLSTAFENISGTVERAKARQASEMPEDKDSPMEGLDALLRKVSAVVTGGGSDGGGLLAKVIEFNKFLERAETVLREGHMMR
ncbi:hypothetical protein RUND412_001216 [Rhizina undulata]